MSSHSPFEPYWLYEMSKDAVKHPNRKVSNGAFAITIICFIILLILLGVFIAICIWFFT